MVGERSDPETIEKIRKEIGSDRSLIEQYLGYISLLLRGELGRSYYTNRRIADDIIVKVPNTFKLAAMAMFMSVPTGILLGLLSGVTRNAIIDRVISFISILGLSLPVFWSGLILMFFLSLKLKLLPPSGTGSFRYLLLPALTLSLPAMSTLSRITRVSVLDIRDMPFIRTARAKGLSDISISVVHVFRNALIPVVTVAGLEFGSYLSGAVLTETIFGWDGIGRFAMEGIIKRDYPVIMGCILVTTLFFVLINIIVDIAYHFLDPRLRIHGTDH
jgi:ABC-type dipeptide/oligopeptide/nickel transport system permease component